MADKISLVVFMACLFFVGLCSLVIAVGDQEQDQAQQRAMNKSVNESQGIGLGVMNKTFLQCVSDAAKVKNTCYSTTKDAYATCRQNASRQDARKCRTDYSKALQDCKSTFKSKRNECKVLKHNFFDSIRASFM